MTCHVAIAVTLPCCCACADAFAVNQHVAKDQVRLGAPDSRVALVACNHCCHAQCRVNVMGSHGMSIQCDACAVACCCLCVLMLLLQKEYLEVQDILAGCRATLLVLDGKCRVLTRLRPMYEVWVSLQVARKKINPGLQIKVRRRGHWGRLVHPCACLILSAFLVDMYKSGRQVVGRWSVPAPIRGQCKFPLNRPILYTFTLGR
jgi:hypothetical protein